MSLVRAFTTRRNRVEEVANASLGRAASQRAGKPVHRSQISSPVELVSTTNPLSFEAPSIAGTVPVLYRNASSSSSTSSESAEDSDASTLSINTNTDASSIEEDSPISTEPEPNHLSCYFKPAVDTKSSRSSTLSDRPISIDAPAIPQRVPSHSKKAHEQVHRKRSVQRLMSPPASIARRTSADMFGAPPVETPNENPFGNELAQLDEVQEELSFVVQDAERDADAAYMDLHGLASYGAADYLTEIHELLYDVFLAEEPCWI